MAVPNATEEGIEMLGEEAQGAGAIPIAAGLHRDGTIHIYVHGEDSGLSVALDDNGTLVVKVDESKREIKVK